MSELRRGHLIAVLALLGAAAVSPWLPAPAKERPLARVGFADLVPDRAGPWKRVSLRELSPEGSANEMVEALFAAEGEPDALLTLEYSSDQRRAHELHYPHICHRVRGDELVIHPERRLALVPGLELPLFAFEWHQRPAGARASCVFWVVLDGEPTSDVAAVKWRQLWTGLLGHVHEGVLVRLDTLHAGEPDVAARARVAASLESFLRELHAALPPGAGPRLFGGPRGPRAR